jgi:predicted polyphosphate/ATP-dependent NAD kinase
VKIHSGVYTLTPSLAGSLITDLIEGRLVRMEQAEVRDIDESEFRQGRVRAKYYGELLVPAEHQYVQSVKEGGKEVEELVVADIAADFVEQMDPELLYVMGSGTTVAAIMDELGLENTLLGTDLIKDGEVVASDCSAQQLLELVGDAPFKIVITPIGGQGHLLGRGNQQLSPQLIQKVGLPGLYVVATRSKIVGLNGRPLIIDSGDPELDRKLTGVVTVHTGYRDAVIYRVGI